MSAARKVGLQRAVACSVLLLWHVGCSAAAHPCTGQAGHCRQHVTRFTFYLSSDVPPSCQKQRLQACCCAVGVCAQHCTADLAVHACSAANSNSAYVLQHGWFTMASSMCASGSTAIHLACWSCCKLCSMCLAGCAAMHQLQCPRTLQRPLHDCSVVPFSVGSGRGGHCAGSWLHQRLITVAWLQAGTSNCSSATAGMPSKLKM
jgi:hypothetical protein